MKQLNIFLLFAFTLMSAALPVQNTYTIAKGYIVTIKGTSNLHAWDETVQTVNGVSTVSWNTDGSFNLDAVNIKMDVRSIKSDMGSIMNNNTYKALKADANPKIIFELSAPVKSVQAKPTEMTLSAKGNLTIAGVTRPVEMQIKASMPEREQLEFEGSQTIKMTDYGVTPPTALFGTLKTGDEITIHFKTSFTLMVN